MNDRPNMPKKLSNFAIKKKVFTPNLGYKRFDIEYIYLNILMIYYIEFQLKIQNQMQMLMLK